MPGMKAVLLARVSSAKQVDGFSLDAQLARLRDYCAARNLEIVREFVFEESSTRGDRRHFMDAIAFCKSHRETVALVADAVDRIQRSFKEWQMLEKMRKNKTLELHFVRENMIIAENSPPFVLGMWEMLISLASGHIRNLSANVRRGMNQKAAEGEWGALAPIGYRNWRENGARRAKIFVDDETAPIVQRLFNYYSTGQYNLTEMTNFAAAWGLKSPRTGQPYPKQTIISMLSNPFYYGEMKWNGQLIPHVYPPLVSREIWDACDRHRRGLGKAQPKYGKMPFIYRGLIRCANTGKLVSTQRKRDKYNYLGAWDANGKLLFVREEEITEQIAQILDTLKMPDDQLTAMARSLKQSKSAEKEFQETQLRRMRLDLTNAENRRSALIDAFLDKNIDKDIYDEKLMELNRRRAEISAQITALTQTDDQFNDRVISLFTAAQGYGNDWRWFMSELAEIQDSNEKSSKIEQGRQFLKSIFRTLELNEKNLGFSLHAPFNALQKSQGCQEWSGRHDSNMRHLAPKASTLPD